MQIVVFVELNGDGVRNKKTQELARIVTKSTSFRDPVTRQSIDHERHRPKGSKIIPASKITEKVQKGTVRWGWSSD